MLLGFVALITCFPEWLLVWVACCYGFAGYLLCMFVFYYLRFSLLIVITLGFSCYGLGWAAIGGLLRGWFWLLV